MYEIDVKPSALEPLSQDFVNSCPLQGGFRMRGLEMTRIEVFVDAAFAFAVTMTMISFDAIPSTFSELVIAIKGIPAFIVAVIQLIWIWYAHNLWSKRFGLEDAKTVVLSTGLLIVMLIYIYPMRIMAGGMFSWFTGGYLPSGFDISTLEQLSLMFVFLGIGFVAICLLLVFMYRYAGSLKTELLLSDAEFYETKTVEYMWLGAAAIGLLSIVLALLLPADFVPFAGFAFALLGFWFSLVRARRRRTRPPA